MSMKPPVDGKFVAYGGSSQMLDTEVRGDVLRTDPGSLFIAPDPNYRNLCLIGNSTFPKSGEDGFSQNQDVINGAAGRPIMKCELYQVGARQDPTHGQASGPPTVTQGGQQRPLAVGDKIRIHGLYAVDYAHPWTWSVWTDSFTVMRGVLEAGYVHSELHPYAYYDIALLSELSAADQRAETHTFVAPVCPEQYSSTYLANKLDGVAGDLVDNAMWNGMTATLHLDGGPSPGAAFERQLAIANVQQLGSPPTITSQASGATGLDVNVQISGTDILNPSIYIATFSVSWVQALRVSWTPSPVPVDTPVDLTFTVRDATGKVVPNCQILLNGVAAGTSGSKIRKTFHHITVTETERVIDSRGKPHLIHIQVPAAPAVTVTAQKEGYEDAHAKLNFGPVHST